MFRSLVDELPSRCSVHASLHFDGYVRVRSSESNDGLSPMIRSLVALAADHA
jgi:hypothetical protein